MTKYAYSGNTKPVRQSHLTDRLPYVVDEIQDEIAIIEAAISGGDEGQVLTADANGKAKWKTLPGDEVSSDEIISETEDAGKVLTANGTGATWETLPGDEVSSDEIISEIEDTGKVLTANGMGASWEAIPEGVPASPDERIVKSVTYTWDQGSPVTMFYDQITNGKPAFSSGDNQIYWDLAGGGKWVFYDDDEELIWFESSEDVATPGLVTAWTWLDPEEDGPSTLSVVNNYFKPTNGLMADGIGGSEWAYTGNFLLLEVVGDYSSDPMMKLWNDIQIQLGLTYPIDPDNESPSIMSITVCELYTGNFAIITIGSNRQVSTGWPFASSPAQGSFLRILNISIALSGMI